MTVPAPPLPAAPPLPSPSQTCPKCRMAVPTGAYVCAYCKKRLRTSPLTWGVLGFIVLCVVVSVFSGTKSPPAPTPPAAPVAETLAPKAAPDTKKAQGKKGKKQKVGKTPEEGSGLQAISDLWAKQVGHSLVDSWEKTPGFTGGTIIVVNLNPTAWDALGPAQQRQLAGLGAWDVIRKEMKGDTLFLYAAGEKVGGF